MRLQRSTSRGRVARCGLVALLIAVLPACVAPDDPLEDDSVRHDAAVATDAAVEVLDGIDGGGAALATQEVDLCSDTSTQNVGGNGPPIWYCSVFALKVIELPTQDRTEAIRHVVESLAAAGYEVDLSSTVSWTQLGRGEDVVAVLAVDAGPDTRIHIAVGEGSVSPNRALDILGQDARLMASSGDDVVTVPVEAADAVTCECLQWWISVEQHYATVPVAP